MAFAQHRDFQFEFASLTDETLPNMLENALHAVELDGADYLAHWILALAYLHSGEHELALSEAIRSVELNPSKGHGYNVVGLILTLSGQPEDALPYLEKARAISPDDPRLNLMMG